MIKQGNNVLIGVDIGTTNYKGIVIDSEGKILTEASIPNTISYPKPGWAEQNPEDWWKNFILLIKKLIKSNSFNPRDIVGIGITGLGPNLIVLDKEGISIRNAILYSDTRSVEEINYLRENFGNIIFDVSGNYITSQTVAPKILWLKKNETKNFLKINKILIGSYNYIVFKLTNSVSIDYGTAKWTGLFDGSKLMWREDLCDMLDIPIDLLPPVNHATTIVGDISKNIALKLGIPSNVSVIAGALDSATETLSAGVININDSIISYGTTTIFKVVVPDFKKDLRLHSDIHCIKPLKYFLGGAMTTTGAIVRWFRDNFTDKKYEILDEEASKIPVSGLIILPYFMGERTPIFDPLARGVIFGLTLHHTSSHVYKAILEATGFALLQHIEILKENNVTVTKTRVVGGGAKSKVWRQIVSDITGIEQQYCITPGASFGAAYLAGYGVGIFNDFNVEKYVKVADVTKPRKEYNMIYKKYYEVFKELYPTLKKTFINFYHCLEDQKFG
jgi:xylulokinase